MVRLPLASPFSIVPPSPIMWLLRHALLMNSCWFPFNSKDIHMTRLTTKVDTTEYKGKQNVLHVHEIQSLKMIIHTDTRSKVIPHTGAR